MISTVFERALRWAVDHHRSQTRKGSSLPYVQHPMAVAMILERAGFPDPVVSAGLLHDLVEDSGVTVDEVRAAFGADMAHWVDACSERTHDAEGMARPWSVRKGELLDALLDAPVEARAIALADKLHNLFSIAYDLEQGTHDWSKFNADRSAQLAFYRQAFDRLAGDDPRLDALAAQGLALLARIEADETTAGA